MPDAISLSITISLACLLAWQLAIKVRVIRHFRQPLPKLIEDHDCPLAVVVLCLRGGDPYLKHTLQRLRDQDYPRYEESSWIRPAMRLMRCCGKRSERTLPLTSRYSS